MSSWPLVGVLVTPVPPEPIGKAPVTSEAKSTEVPSVVCKALPDTCSPVPANSVRVSPPIISVVKVAELNCTEAVE